MKSLAVLSVALAAATFANITASFARGAGPHKALDDAELVRSNIRGCPKQESGD